MRENDASAKSVDVATLPCGTTLGYLLGQSVIEVLLKIHTYNVNSGSYPQLSAFGREGKCLTLRKSRKSLGSSSFSKMTACGSRKWN